MDIPLRPEVLRWARERARLDVETLAKRLGTSPGRVGSWESDGRIRPKQVEKLARVTHTAVGLLYLPEPPVETLPVPDFRTLRDEEMRTPSPDLLDVIDQARQRQDWFRDYLAGTGEDPLDWVGSLRTDMPVQSAAEEVRRAMGLDTELRRSASTWEEALRLQIALIEEHGAMVMRSGIVGNDTHRPLSVDEFRGFALADSYAPLIFINATDTKGAQMFTLAHELMHIWVGASGVSNLDKTYPADAAIERFCNSVAAELLVPADELRAAGRDARTKADPEAALARRFKVSRIVILRRLRDLDMISRDTFLRQYREQQEFFLQQQEKRASGGDFYNTQRSRTGDRFAVSRRAASPRHLERRNVPAFRPRAEVRGLMPYLLDANTLIQAKNEYYAFDICPGFWDWLEIANASGDVSSIEPVAEELRKGKDDLATWAAARRGTFFRPLDAAAHAEMTAVATWVQTQDFRDDAKRVFFAGADPFLIAFAKANGLTVASHKVHVEGQKNKVKIPTVCQALGVPCVRTFAMLRDMEARFVFEK